jgi:transposase
MIATEGVLSREEMETRRLAAAIELQGGLTQSKVASKFGVSRTTASRWARALNHNGVDGLKKRRATGRPSRLRLDQLAELRAIYNEGALASGFESDRWTTCKLAQVIEQKFGVHYDQDHVGRLLHKLGLRTRRRPAPAPTYVPSVYAPNMDRMASEISPTVA